MDYESFFGLKEKPFSTSPDERFYYDSPQHSKALKKILHCIDNRLGLSLLVADIGMGKTTLARRLLNMLSSDESYEVSLLIVIHPDVSAGWFLKKISLQLGVEDKGDDREKIITGLYDKLQEYYEKKKKVAVLIDEGNMLRKKDTMEEIRGLLNIEADSHHLLNFVIFGLPEMEENLKQDEALYERTAVRTTLQPLDLPTVKEYIAHRIKVAGGSSMPFTEASLNLIHKFSRGKPRSINIICENALLEAFLEKKKVIEPEIMNVVLKDLGLLEEKNG
ncbi:MAG: AAA family ATPase [candidate division WOR-3 bacterium]